MNCKEHHLPELELATGQVREALQCILHTILFIRSPGTVVPYDVSCEGFDLTYTRIASDHQRSIITTSSNSNHQNNINNSNAITNVDKKVDDAIESFFRSLTQIGPELMSGSIVLSFYERRASKQLFGLVSHEERIIWEQWILRVVVNNTPRPIGDHSTAIIERQRLLDTTENMLRNVLHQVLDLAGAGDLQHIPPISYEFELSTPKRVAGSSTTSGGMANANTTTSAMATKDDREHVYARVAHMPSLLQLGN